MCVLLLLLYVYAIHNRRTIHATLSTRKKSNENFRLTSLKIALAASYFCINRSNEIFLCCFLFSVASYTHPLFIHSHVTSITIRNSVSFLRETRCESCSFLSNTISENAWLRAHICTLRKRYKEEKQTNTVMISKRSEQFAADCRITLIKLF